ncbi:zinc-dependent alcohol dehydrogenase family protein [Erwinia sorbitola]|uniref:Zinc-binding dehydrogenase n=1 Tax=Erwinia sorbitola TaxID=2681984 RepID=A0A6I6EXB5_9GAMM|nr:zinc-dependent alcohol dehydrogenase family protein [Erwinia sorbitola]MTD27352.1 zinc-binding dehydrogenase [Erwinia sorbitola]QGU88893.1 zinc-binding dehydrogenase [Erwinia sorbitola]
MKETLFTRAVVREFGNIAEVMRLEQSAQAELSAGQVRVKMTFATINPSDIITISGAYRSRIALPFVPGFEGVGRISESDDASLPVGQRVLPVGSMGAWQQYKDSDAQWCFTLPDFVTDRQAATSYVNPMTALLMLTEELHFTPGMRIIINAANSAIGKMLIRIANHLGLKPVAIVRKAENLGLFSDYVTEQVLNSSAADYPQALNALAHSGGVAAILDCIGGEESLTLAHALMPGGQFIHYGLLSGQPIPATFWRSRPDIRFSNFHLRLWVHGHEKTLVQRKINEVMALIRDGVIATEIVAEYALDEIDQAVRDVQSGELKGKILLRL